jgi:outer membrane protein W
MKERAMRRLLPFFVVAVIAVPAVASAQQWVNINVGGFVPRSADARGDTVNGQSNDVLVNNMNFLAFNIKDFNGPTIGGEYLVGLGNWFEGGLGIGLYSRTVPTVYNDFVNANGTEITQDLKLRIVPFTATVRFLPMGRHNGIEPYIGGGVGVFNYRYTETGQFLATDNSIFSGNFVGSGTERGPVILGGVRVPVGGWAIGGEIRYQSAAATLPADQGFAGTKIDLGGFNYLLTVGFKF